MKKSASKGFEAVNAKGSMRSYQEKMLANRERWIQKRANECYAEEYDPEFPEIDKEFIVRIYRSAMEQLPMLRLPGSLGSFR